MKTITGIVAVLVVSSCSATPKQTAEGAKTACTLVQAFSQEKIVEEVCATAAEILDIVTAIESMRVESKSDGGPTAAKLDKCRLIPTTKTCATESETLTAIRKLKATK
jgi:hypothetical protein